MRVLVLCFALLAVAHAQETSSDDEDVKVVQIPGGVMTISKNGNSIVQSSHTSSSSSGPQSQYNRVASVSNWQVGPDGKQTGGMTILTDDGEKQNTIQFGDEPPKVTKFEEIEEIEFPEIPDIEFPEVPTFEMPPMPKFEMPQMPSFNFFPFPGFPAPWRCWAVLDQSALVPFRPVQPFFSVPNFNFNFPKPNQNGNFVSTSTSVSNNNGKVAGQTVTSHTNNGNTQSETVQFVK